MTDAQFIDSLRAALGECRVVTDAGDFESYNVNWRHVFRCQARCAALPRSTREVLSVVRLCAASNLAIVPHDGNTGLYISATPDCSGRQVVLSLARMHATRDIHTLGETMDVESRCILQSAQEAATQAGLLLTISQAAEGPARTGGILSTSVRGTHALRHGMFSTRVLGIEAMTAEGEIVSGLRRLRTDNAVYDWKQWFIGAEGTLGIIIAAVPQMTTQSRHRITALLAVPTPEAALHMLYSPRQLIDETLNAFELISGTALELVARPKGLRTLLASPGLYVLVDASSCLPSVREAVNVSSRSFLRKAMRPTTSSRSRSGRMAISGCSASRSPKPSRVNDDLSRTMLRCPRRRQHPIDVIVLISIDGHALNMLVHYPVMQHGGSISAEHGIGQYRVSELERCGVASELQVAQRIQRALDPAATMNPGKVISFTQHATQAG